jgi:2-alkenal reductase
MWGFIGGSPTKTPADTPPTTEIPKDLENIVGKDIGVMKRSTRTFLILLVTLSLAGLACSAVTGLSTLTPDPTTLSDVKINTPPAESNNNPIEPSQDLFNQENTLVELYQRVNPGIVAIRVLSEEGSGLGSGFVIDDQGHVITNFHVVENATELEVDFPSGFKTRAKVLGTDLDSDIAVLQIENLPTELYPIPFGDSSLLQIGQTVVAIGNPHGLNGTMTTGIVSSLGRTMESLHEAPGGGLFTAGDIIQTDAAINPGNSGGPLLNLNGEVIGVNVAIQSNSFDLNGQPVNTGIGFAISINIVKRVVPSLIADGEYEYPYLGIRSLDEINLFQQEELDLPRSTGVYILEVTPDSPAAEAGLIGGFEATDPDSTDLVDLYAGGDLIIAIDGSEVRDFGDLISYLLNHKGPGDTVMLTVIRDTETIELALTLGKRP